MSYSLKIAYHKKKQVLKALIHIVSPIFLQKEACRLQLVSQNSVREGWLYQCQGKKVPEHHSSLRPSEKELPDWCSSALHHKNTPAYNAFQFPKGLNLRYFNYEKTYFTTLKNCKASGYRTIIHRDNVLVCLQNDREWLTVITIRNLCVIKTHLE
jgi:hypothetical protein